MDTPFIAGLFGPALAKLRVGHWYDRAENEVLAGGSLRERVRARADELRELGVRAGKVAVIRESSPLSFAVNYLAAGVLGAVLVPMERGLAPEDETRRHALVRASVVCDGRAVHALDHDRPPAALPPEVGQILFTGGTTGTPKAVLQTHRGLVANVEAVGAWAQYDADDLVLATLPLFHCYGINWTVLAPLLAGASVEAFGRLSASALARHRSAPTAWPTVPAAVEVVLRSPAARQMDWSRLRFCIVGGAPSAQDLSERFRALTGRPVLNGYGATEATSFVSAPPLQTQSQPAGDVGAPGKGILVRPGASYGDHAELEVGGPSVMAGYLDDSAATAAALTDDGWLRTGDLFERGPSGTVVLKGRLKNFINRGGEKIDPVSVAAAVAQHPAVADAVVFGLPDETFGEVVACVAEATAEIDVAQLRDFLAGLLSPYAIPSVLHLVERLPRNAAGKIAAAEVRKLLPAQGMH
ncbi:class I adenylate-forming enzyme family protein [Amycolatopsis circi]|uniref:class I adenylate-forming enzyme family protein n=1 Tax=Amycolatopsis circi TaxID=871959 RepID=UPI0013BE9883|nr:class I adenylate-forming enzyme family protein [Amycolatopsis circi]